MTAGSAPRGRRGGGDDDALVVAFVTTLLISIVLVVVMPSGGPGALPAPPSAPDRVPAGPVIATVPPNCAISPGTVGRLVAEPRLTKQTLTECQWTSGGGGASRRSLYVGIGLHHGTGGALANVVQPGRSPIGAAMMSFGARWSGSSLHAVTGLGDEAIVRYSPSDGSTVVARIGNATVVVTYLDTRRPMPEDTARNGAFTAASEVVDRLGARSPSRPAVAPAADPSPARETPDVCDAVSERTLNRLVRDDREFRRARPEEAGLVVRGARGVGCSWTSQEQRLRVAAVVVSGNALWDGTRLAARAYTIGHNDARAEETLSVRDEKIFHSVPDLGDQAFTVHVPGVLPGTVVFRDGDLLVQASYGEVDERHPMEGGDAVRGAYAAARDVAEALASH
ncbi:MAG TPA: hypothetical protein VIL71_09420 [Spirillospora sp.]